MTDPKPQSCWFPTYSIMDIVKKVWFWSNKFQYIINIDLLCFKKKKKKVFENFVSDLESGNIAVLRPSCSKVRLGRRN